VARRRRRTERGVKAFVDLWTGCFAKHNLLTWASAIAFNVLVALVPLSVLTLGVLGALDEQRVWKEQISPGIEHRLPSPTWKAVDYAAERILTHASAGLIVFGVVLSIFEISGSVRAVMGALNRMYDTADERGWLRRSGTSYALAIAIGGCMVGSILVLTLAEHLGGSLHVLVGIGRWILAVLLLGAAVELLVRFAPAEPRAKRWVTLGTAFIVVGWVIASLIFKWYVSSVASFKSTLGSFVAVMVLTAYLYVSAIVFLVGVQVDELIRKDATAAEGGPLGHVLAALGQRG
jgi:membrane protein